MLAIVWQYGVVDALSSLLGVELAIVAILVLAFEVVDAIGNIAGLLNLDNETAVPMVWILPAGIKKQSSSFTLY